MKINGYKLQQAIREAMIERDTLAARFEPALTHFPGEDPENPIHTARNFQQAEKRLCALQTAQARYNLAVKVSPLGETMTLCQAIKLVGGAGRMEKMWRSAGTPKKDRYSYREETRDKDTVVAMKTLTTNEIDRERKAAHRWAAALRTAIAGGNAVEMDLSDISDDDKLTLGQ